jgi:hypothetical protein
MDLASARQGWLWAVSRLENVMNTNEFGGSNLGEGGGLSSPLVLSSEGKAGWPHTEQVTKGSTRAGNGLKQ